MSQNESVNTASAISFLSAVPLRSPPAGVPVMGTDDLPGLPEYSAGVQQAVTVGSQISEFAKSVPASIRPHIDNAFAMAQLAADFHIKENGGTTSDWYKKYVEVLTNVGWTAESIGDALREVSGASLEVHKEIIPIISAALGPAATAASVVIAALKGLENMNADQPWITLFDKESQRASANQFQVSYVDVDAEKMPRLTLASFELNASRSVTQVLFFKFSKTNATLRHNETKMSINQITFDAAKKVIAQRMASRAQGYITDLKF